MDENAKDSGLRLLPRKFLPSIIKRVNKEFVQQNRSVIIELFKDLSTLDNEAFNKAAIDIITLMWNNMQSELQKAFQDHMTIVAARFGLNKVTDVSGIINDLIQVKAGDNKYIYAERVVAVCYVPTKGDENKIWVKEAEEKIAEKYKIKFTQGSVGHKRQNCLVDIARAMYNDTFGVRVRRAMISKFGYHLTMRNPANGAEPLSCRGVTYYLYRATSPRKRTETRVIHHSLQSLFQQQYDKGKSLPEIKEEALSAISRLQTIADLGITETEKGDSGTGKGSGSDLNCDESSSDDDLGTGKGSGSDLNCDESSSDDDSGNGKCSGSDLNRDESSSDDDSGNGKGSGSDLNRDESSSDGDESSDDESGDEEEMFLSGCEGQGQGGYDLVHALSWCGETHKSREDVKPNEMNGNVYVCPDYKVWPSYAMYCAVKENDHAKVKLMMDDFLPVCDKDFHKLNISRVKQLYMREISYRYREFYMNNEFKATAEGALRALTLDIELQQKNQKVSMQSQFTNQNCRCSFHSID